MFVHIEKYFVQSKISKPLSWETRIDVNSELAKNTGKCSGRCLHTIAVVTAPADLRGDHTRALPGTSEEGASAARAIYRTSAPPRSASKVHSGPQFLQCVL